jgi:hypothetical protein
MMNERKELLCLTDRQLAFLRNAAGSRSPNGFAASGAFLLGSLHASRDGDEALRKLPPQNQGSGTAAILCA